MVSAIIVAAGKGIRMSDTERKQYVMLSGRPILAYTLTVFDACEEIDKIFLVIPEEDFDFCQQTILLPLGLKTKIKLVAGGTERQDSVYNGLLAIDKPGDSIVIIHDGVRPFIRVEHLTASVNGAKESGACILGIPASDTLKRVDNAGYIDETFNRDSMWLAQTPQSFQLDLIIKAHEQAIQDGYRGTDDALLVERMGKKVKIISGSRYNIKITTQEDLILAKAMIQTEDL